jgi:DNA polymerase V
VTQLKEAIATHTGKLAEKLRQERLVTQTFFVSIRTNRFAPIEQYRATQEVHLDVPTSSTDGLLPHALKAVEVIFKPGFQYYKAGVSASELMDADLVQPDLFSTQTNEKSQRLMKAMDQINRKLGSGSVKYAAVGLKQEWQTRVACPSKQYTTRWSDLPVVQA